MQCPAQTAQPWLYLSWYVALLTQNPAGEDVGCEIVDSATVGVADGCCDEPIDGADVGDGSSELTVGIDATIDICTAV